MRRAAVLAAGALIALAGLPAKALALAELKFGTVPALPALPAVTLTAKAQTTNATMTNFSVTDTRLTKSGWDVTVQGQSGAGKSAVFAQYCPKATCGTDKEGFVTGGASLPANSLTLNSTGAKFSGGIGSTPELKCSAGCFLDSATAVKVVSAASSESTWTTSGFTATSLALATATSLMALKNEEVYRVNLLWTLASGP
jgi:hypothetical protein